MPEGKKVILYAPTWRDNQHVSGVGYTLQLPIDFDRLRSELGDEYVILFRAHYFVANEFDFERYAGFITNVSDVSNINDLYIASDMLVTDYSSVFFDYAILQRPIIFYMYDLDEYVRDIRGFYFGLEELPGPVARTEAELVAAVRSAETPSAELRNATTDSVSASRTVRWHASERFLLASPSRTTVLYAPTYRRNRPDRYQDVLDRFDDPRYALVIKPHPLVESNVAGENVVNASGVDVLDLLPLCDAVITDYSAVAFEAAVLDKPIYFFLYDFEEYEREHGLNVDLFAEMPGVTSRDLSPIAERSMPAATTRSSFADSRSDTSRCETGRARDRSPPPSPAACRVVRRDPGVRPAGSCDRPRPAGCDGGRPSHALRHRDRARDCDRRAAHALSPHPASPPARAALGAVQELLGQKLLVQPPGDLRADARRQPVRRLRARLGVPRAHRPSASRAGPHGTRPPRGPCGCCRSKRHRPGRRVRPRGARSAAAGDGVVWGSREHDIAHARCAYWFANTVIPWHLAPRPGQAYVQAWHGTPLKKLGCDIDLTMANNALYSGRQTHKRYRREGERITHLVTPSAFATEHLCSAMGLSAEQCARKVVEVGYPRNDALSGFTPQAVEAIKRRLGMPAAKKVVLYAPTWRDDQYATSLGYTLDLGVDFEALRAQLGDGYVVLFRAHYLIASQFDFERLGGFVLDVSDVSDVNDLYAASDVLVTDYSSVFFDFANLGKPIVFYMYDLDYYASEMRGFYVDLPDLPGPIVTDQPGLVGALAAADSPDDDLERRYHRFRERFNPMDDGHASERVLERVIDWRTGA